LKKSEPDRALVLFDRAARLAGDVQNFWWFGIALMEGAATRAVHGDPVEAAPMLVEVLNHWERVGDWVEQWVALRYITRFLARLGSADDALFLQRVIVNAGKPAPLHRAQVDALVGSLDAEQLAGYRHFRESAVGGAAAVTRARSSLQRYTEQVGVPAR
jgi:hypothetical protein